MDILREMKSKIKNYKNEEKIYLLEININWFLL